MKQHKFEYSLPLYTFLYEGGQSFPEGVLEWARKGGYNTLWIYGSDKFLPFKWADAIHPDLVVRCEGFQPTLDLEIALAKVGVHINQYERMPLNGTVYADDIAKRWMGPRARDH